MIEVHGLVKSFGPTYALRDIDFEVAVGEFLTILGPNGAGKTTLLRALATLLKPTSGRIRISGMDLRSDSMEIRRRLGFVSHRPFTYANLTVEENLTFYGRLYDVRPLGQRVEQLLALVGLDGRRRSRACTLSRGMQQRLSLARAIIHDPALMLLDEPYAGLDQQAIMMLRELLVTVRKQSHTVVMATHNLERGFELCDQLVILSHGRIVYQNNKDSLTLATLQDAYWQHTGNKSGGKVVLP